MKEHKGRGIVLLKKHKYIKKCLTWLNTNQFTKLHDDSTKSYEVRTQQTVRK